MKERKERGSFTIEAILESVWLKKTFSKRSNEELMTILNRSQFF